jgi:hypothetical protein
MYPKPWTINCRWLLAIYLVIPLTVAFALIDTALLDRHLQARLGLASLALWPALAAVATWPHIFASTITMADRGYLRHYWRKLIGPVMFFTVITSAAYLGVQPFELLLPLLMAVYTIYHVLAQQIGLSLMMLRCPSVGIARAWKWLSVAASLLVYLLIGAKRMLAHPVGGVALSEIAVYLLIGAMAALIICAALLCRYAKHRIGAWYIWSNVVMIGATALMWAMQYHVFVILIPRVIHDATAYLVYITHDRNRLADRPHNLMHGMSRISRLPSWVLTPAVSVAISYALWASDNVYLWAAAAIITFVHYYMEGFIWRAPNPHRKYVQFA